MMGLRRAFGACLFAATLHARAVAASLEPDVARTPDPVVAASSSPAPESTSDPCGGPGRLLATLNRPTVGYSSCALPKGMVVLEEGYQNQSQGGKSPNVLATYPQGFERVGVADRFELDLIGPAYNRTRVGNAIATGYSDFGLGFKAELPQKGRFTYAVDGLFQAATGTGGFSAGGPTSVANVDIAYAASPAIGFSTTLASGVTSGMTTMGKTARYGYFLPSIVITAQIPNYYQFYAELVGQTKLGPDRGGHIFTDFGLQKLLSPNFEVDGEYGSSFPSVGEARFQYVGIGVGVRVK